jgi:putative flippase GtrA
VFNKHLNKKNTKEVSLYITTGILGSLIDLLSFTVALWLGASPIIAQWLGASIGAIHNSLIHHYVVFAHDKKLSQTFLPNSLLSITTIFASGPALLLLNHLTHNIWLSKVLILAITAIISYLIRKIIIFK